MTKSKKDDSERRTTEFTGSRSEEIMCDILYIQGLMNCTTIKYTNYALYK